MKPQNKKPLEFGRLTLNPDGRYRVVREFQDYDCKLHSPGEEWAFVGYDLLPYDAGYTLHVSFEKDHEGVIRMQDHPEAQERILTSFEQYVTQAQQVLQADAAAQRGLS